MTIRMTPITIPAGLKAAIAEARAAVREWYEEHGDEGSMNARAAAWLGQMPVSESPVVARYTGSVPHHVGRYYDYEAMHDPVRELLVQALMDGAAEIAADGAWIRGVDEDEASERVTWDGGETWHPIPAHIDVEADGADHIDEDGAWHVYSARLRSRVIAPYED
jgi:hypothetical protein